MSTVTVQIGRTEIDFDALDNKKIYKSVATQRPNYQAVQINSPFHLHSGSDRVRGKAGDYVCQEITSGVIFPMSKQQFERVFTEA